MKDVLILSDDTSEAAMLGSKISTMKSTWQSAPKNKAVLAKLADTKVTILRVGEAVELDLEIIRLLRQKIPYHPIIALDTEKLKMGSETARDVNAILRSPLPADALEKCLLRFLSPNANTPNRVYPRFDAHLDVTWSHLSGSTVRESQTVNVSLTGAFIKEGHICPRRGAIIDLTIRSQHKNLIIGKSIVRWIATQGSGALHPGFGVEFLSPVREIISAVVGAENVRGQE